MNAVIALFVRALRQDTRGAVTYLARAGLATLMIILLFTTQQTRGWIGAPGLQFFTSTTYMNFFFITVAGLSYFASAITEEKEEQTLGLLRMTNLNPLSILLGKSTNRLFGALLLLLSQFPFTVLAIAFGGITFNQIVAVYCTLAAYLIMLSSLALIASVVARRTAGASSLTSILIIIYFIGPAFLQMLLERLGNAWDGRFEPIASALHPFLAAWTQIVPLQRLQEILRTGFNGAPVSWAEAVNVGLGLIFFGIAWALFEPCNSEQRDPEPARSLFSRRNARRGGLFRPGRTWKHAILWKDYHFLAGGSSGTIAKLLVYLLVLGITFSIASDDSLLVLFSDRDGRQRAASIIVVTMLIALAVETVFAANRIFRIEVRARTLSTLGVLPTTWRRIVYEKTAAALLGLWPAALLLGTGLVMMIGNSSARARVFKMKYWLAQDIEWLLVPLLTIASTLCFIHMVANLSVRVKWGALPLAFVITYFGAMIFAALAARAVAGGLLLELFVLTAITIALHLNISIRLHELAEKE
jgi:hypothetical protein